MLIRRIILHKIRVTAIMVTLISCLSITGVQAQPVSYSFNPLTEQNLVIWGQGYGVNSLKRFPASVQASIPSDVWSNSQMSAGLQLRFKTNASSITVNHRGSSTLSGNEWFSPVGTVGMDMYALRQDGRWYWCHPNTKSLGSVFTYALLEPNDPSYVENGYEYCLYLPTFASLSALTITVNTGAAFQFIPVTQAKKPIVIYGTSIVHGAVAVRPGNAWANIVSRAFYDRPVINLGFSGTGRVEPAVINAINQIDADVYVIDCLPNFTSTDMINNINTLYTNAVNTIRNSHPNAVIVLTEHPGYADMDTYTPRKTIVTNGNNNLKTVYQQLISAGVNKLYYLSREDIGLDMTTDMGDYIHPNDKGMYVYAKAYIKLLEEILNESPGNSMKSAALPESVRIYPTVNNGNFTLEAPDLSAGLYYAEIYDINGRVVYRQTLSSELEHISLKNVSAGYYVLKLKGNGAGDLENQFSKIFIVK
jgi:lysophospholipase L1-like esterase